MNRSTLSNVVDVHSRGRLRIGELSKRVGVRPETLRAWERRYSLLAPQRSGGNYRLYTADDEARIRIMKRLISRGYSPAEAARLAREAPKVAERIGSDATEAGRAASSDAAKAVPLASEDTGAGANAPAPAVRPINEALLARLIDALVRYDESRAHRVLDDILARVSLDTALADFVLPAMAEVGERWARGQIDIAEEHFATELIRGRLLALARGWGGGSGPLALLACPAGERHDIGLLCFGLALRARGWRITYLGTDVPGDTLIDAARDTGPDVVVVAAIDSARFEDSAESLGELAESHALVLAGAGADAGVARELGARHLPLAPIDAADWIARPVVSPAA